MPTWLHKKAEKKEYYPSDRYAYKTKEKDPIYVPVNRIQTPFQTDEATNPKKVRENVRKMKAGVPLAPIVIGYKNHVLHDGHHRLEAAKKLGHTHVPCVVGGRNERRVKAADKRYRKVWKSARETVIENGKLLVKRWITIHPNGKGAAGKYGDKDYRRIEIDASGRIIGGSIPKSLHGKPIHEAFKKQNKVQPYLSKQLNDIGVHHTMEVKDNGYHEYVIGNGVQNDKDKFGRPTAKRGTVKFKLPNSFAEFNPDEWVHVHSNFGDKDKLKAMGARFDGDTKTWNIPLKDIPNVAKHFEHATISHHVAEKFEKLHGNNEKYTPSVKETKEKIQREHEVRAQEELERENAKKKREDEIAAQEEADREKYKGMSANEIRDAVRGTWPQWKRDLHSMRGHLVYDSFGSGYTMNGKLSREDFVNARKQNEIFQSDANGWLIRPHQYPRPYYDAVKQEKEEEGKKQKSIQEFQNKFRKESIYPQTEDRKQIPKPTGETFVVHPMNIYGGGEEFIIDKEEKKIWNIQNNGTDGGDWSQNNIRTGGAGAIGRYIPYTKEKADEIRKLFSVKKSFIHDGRLLIKRAR